MAAQKREIDVRISGPAWPLEEAEAAALVVRVLQAVEAGIGPLRDGTLEVWLASDADLQALNLQFRDKDAPTNVLSFAAASADTAHFVPAFGQLALADGVCMREAQARGLELQDHFCHLVLHGLLHLQGYDHESQNEADTMQKLERTMMATLGLHDPYSDLGVVYEQ
jgi:probable rRNA maturation factor